MDWMPFARQESDGESDRESESSKVYVRFDLNRVVSLDLHISTMFFRPFSLSLEESCLGGASSRN